MGKSNKLVKYIILSNGQQWCSNCWKAAVDGDNVRFIDSQLPFKANSVIYKLAFRHIRFKSRSSILLPFTSIWHKQFEKGLGIDDSVYTNLIIYDWNTLTKDLGFIKFLKSRHRKLRVVYMFSNIVSISGAKYYNILDSLKTVYDIVFAFDREDSKKYGFDYSPLIYTSFVDFPKISEKQEVDLFYLGMAKDRYDTLIEIFEKAINEGLKCDFTIVGVPEERRRYAEAIKYNPVSYQSAIEGMSKSKCIVDVIQGNSTGLTIKTCEAVVLGRKLLTNNLHVLDENFYHGENICIYNKDLKIRDFIDKPFVEYTFEEKMYFSPNRLFDTIENKLGIPRASL